MSFSPSGAGRISALSMVTACVGIPMLLTSVHADVVHADDVIVDGSLAVGFDAVNGELFGSDTLRLKENTLRIHFDDTSNSGSFPMNDWRILINDSTNGGAEYFAIEDATAGRVPFRVEAGAPSNSLYVEASGEIGIGTSEPSVMLHVQDGNSPALRLHQDGTSGFTQQAWDVAGNETSFFVRDVTNGSALPFRIEPGTAQNTLYLDSTDRVGIGTTSPTHKLHVVGNAFISETLEIGSTRERKEKIRELTLEEAKGALDAMQPVQFHYLEDPNAQLGFIAEDVPDLVATDTRKTVRPMDFVAVLTTVVKEHERRERELIETVAEQQQRIEELIGRLEKVEARVGNREAP